MSTKVPAGATIQLMEHESGNTYSYMTYYVSDDGITLARSGRIPLTRSHHLPGSKPWVKDMLEQLLQAL
jgi:hypothetical protein